MDCHGLEYLVHEKQYHLQQFYTNRQQIFMMIQVKTWAWITTKFSKALFFLFRLVFKPSHAFNC